MATIKVCDRCQKQYNINSYTRYKRNGCYYPAVLEICTNNEPGSLVDRMDLCDGCMKLLYKFLENDGECDKHLSTEV